MPLAPELPLQDDAIDTSPLDDSTLALPLTDNAPPTEVDPMPPLTPIPPPPDEPEPPVMLVVPEPAPALIATHAPTAPPPLIPAVT